MKKKAPRLSKAMPATPPTTPPTIAPTGTELSLGGGEVVVVVDVVLLTGVLLTGVLLVVVLLVVVLLAVVVVLMTLVSGPDDGFNVIFMSVYDRGSLSFNCEVMV